MAKRKGEFFDEENLDSISDESFSTKFKTQSFRISWTIEDYNSVSKIVKFIESPKVPSSCGPSGARQWFLEFEPKLISSESTEYFEFTLKKTIPGDVYVQAALFFKSLTSEKCNWGDYKKVLPSGNFIFWKASISKLSKILKWDETYPNNFTIICDVRTVDSAMNVTRKIKIPCIRNLERDDIITNDISNILEQQLFTDVTFMIGEKKCHAHKTILAARSQIFAEMFFSQKEGEKKESSIVEVEGVDLVIFQILLNFVYTGKVNHLDIFARKIFIAAGKFGLTNLKEICVAYLAGNLSEENAFVIIEFAFQYELKDLKKKAVEFLQKNFVNLKRQPNYRKMIETTPNLVTQLLELMSEMKPPEEGEEIAETSFEFL